MFKSRRSRILVTMLAITMTLGTVGFLARDALFVTFASSDSHADRELKQAIGPLRIGWQQESGETVWEQCMAIARANPKTRAEITAYLFVARNWSGPANTGEAMEKLLPAAKDFRIGEWADALQASRSGSREFEPWRPLAARLIERVRGQPDDQEAARLLCETAVLLHPDTEDESAPPELIQIAGLIQEHYAASPDLANFCEVAGNLSNPAAWSRPFETPVKRILEVNQDRYVRCSAQFALATIVHAGGAERQEEAKGLYKDFLAKFDGKTAYAAQSVEEMNRQWAEQALKKLRAQGIGMAAPEARGADLNGEPLSLEEYRGRVVLVSFWASWCGPCLEAVPRELALLESFAQADFAIFGINADDDLDKAQAAARTHEITWPSLRKESHPKNWNITGYPAYYLLDRNGKIAGSWLGLPAASELDGLIRRLIALQRDAAA